MIVFEPFLADGFEFLNTCDGKAYEVLVALDGRSRVKDWQPIAVHRVVTEGRRSYKPSDFPWLLSQALAMRRSALDAMRDLLDAHGEVLPLAADDGTELYVFNSRVLDALDESHSSLIKFPGTERIMDIREFAFVEATIRDVDIFRLRHRASSTYVSERFVERTKAAGLVGLEFRSVWSSQ